MLDSLHICGNILTTKDYHYFVLCCEKCDSAFGQWSGFIKHLESKHGYDIVTTECKIEDEQYVESKVKREIESELNKQEEIPDVDTDKYETEVAPVVDEESSDEPISEKFEGVADNDDAWSTHEESGVESTNKRKLKTFNYSLLDSSVRKISMQFLKVVEKFPMLWDSKHADHRKPEVRTSVLNDIKEHFVKLGYSISDAVLRRTIPKILRDYKEAKQEAIVCGRASKECALILKKCKFLDDEQSWKRVFALANIESDIDSCNSGVDESIDKNFEGSDPFEGSSSDCEIFEQNAFYSNSRDGKRITFSAASNPLTIELINLVRNNPIFWDTRQQPNYTERKPILESWIPIFEKNHNISFSYKELSLNVKLLRNYCNKLENRKHLNETAQFVKDQCSFLPKVKDTKRIRCDHCDRSFLMQHNYQAHLYSVHKIGENPFKCHVCGKDFPSHTPLDTHLKAVHMKQQTAFCNICNRGFFRSHHLAVHMQVHTGEKSFICEVCGQSFRRRVNLKNHEIRIHLRQRNFACELCPKTFYIKAHLRDHMNVHLNIRNHKCNICGKAFHSSHALMRHRQIHSAIKKYACKLCDARFHQFVGLNSHMKNKHKYVQDRDEAQSTNIDNNVVASSTELSNEIKGEFLQSMDSWNI